MYFVFNCAAQFINFWEKSILHTLIPSCKFYQYLTNTSLHILLDYWKFLSTFLLKIVKIIFVQSFVSIDFKICLPFMLLVKESESCSWNFSSCMLFSIHLHTLLTSEKFPLHNLFHLQNYLIDQSTTFEFWEHTIFCLLNEALKMHGTRCSNKRCHSLYERHLSTHLQLRT